MPPGRRFVVMTCMDARLDPAKFAGLAEGDALVIRNAGGRASDDAIRSLAISYKLLGTRKWFVIHHTDCGMLTFTNEIKSNLLSQSLKTASVDATGWHDSGEGPGSQSPPGPRRYPDLRLHLRLQDWSVCRDTGGDHGWRRGLTPRNGTRALQPNPYYLVIFFIHRSKERRRAVLRQRAA